MPTTEELNAGFDAAHALVVNAENRLPSGGFVNVRERVQQWVESAEGRQFSLSVIQAVLAAAEKVRAKSNAPHTHKP